jgi:hypothetical protein
MRVDKNPAQNLKWDIFFLKIPFLERSEDAPGAREEE